MTLQSSADAVLKAATDAGDVPGVVAMVTDRNDTIYQGAFGTRALGGGGAMTLDTVGLLASMTKAITSTAAMQLVEQGKLELDSPASKWLPDLGAVQVLEGWTGDGQPKLRAPKRPITLKHLLTHTAGFGYEFLSADIQKYQKATGTPSFASSTYASLKTPLLFDPGERWQYGINTDWAGLLVQKVSGQTLEDYFAEHIFKPLGMKDIAIRMTPAMQSRRAAIHARLPDGSLTPIDLVLPQDPETEMGGQALYGTVGEYLKFVRMILNQGVGPGGRVLKPETVKSMSTNQIGALTIDGIKTADPTMTNDMALPPDVPHNWSLAFLLNQKTMPTGRKPGSLMWAGICNSYYWIDPTTGVGGVYLTQILPFADVKSLPLYFSFEATVYQNL